MSLLAVSGVSHSFGQKVLFDNISLAIENNSKIGLIGKNGCGKSTLIKIMAERLTPNNGDIHKAKETKIAYLTQDPELDESQTLYDCILSSRPDYIQALTLINEIETKLENDHDEKVMQQYDKLQHEFELMGGYKLTSEIKLVLNHLNFPQDVWNRNIAGFSGGEKTRIQLARFLLQPFELMLLDEPTNHLDLTMIFWLEKYLSRLNKPYILISHDRRFLETTVNKIVELDNGKLETYNTDYAGYLVEKELREETKRRQFKQQQKLIKRTEDFIARNMAGQKVQQAKSRLKMLDKLDRLDAPTSERNIKLRIKSDNRSGNDVLSLENCSFGFSNTTLAEKISQHVYYQDKIAVLGKNGCGKTTLLRLINSDLLPTNGVVNLGASLSIGYYDQMHVQLNEALTVMQTIWELVPSEPQGYVLTYLARFGFRGEEVDKPVAILSGGEKARLYLARLIHEKPNFLLLDEPTNHLDLGMIDSLEEALNNYEGTIIFVSHDRQFIDRVANKKWFFKNKRVIETHKTLQQLFASTESSETKAAKPKKENDTSNNAKKINPIVLKKKEDELEKKQNSINKFEAELEEMHHKLGEKEVYTNQHKVQEINGRIKKTELSIASANQELDMLEMEYLEMLEA